MLIADLGLQELNRRRVAKGEMAAFPVVEDQPALLMCVTDRAREGNTLFF